MVVDLSLKENLVGETVKWEGELGSIFQLAPDPSSLEKGLLTQPGYEAFFGKLSAEAETKVKAMLLEIKKKEYDLEQLTSEKYKLAKAANDKVTEKAATAAAETDPAVREAQFVIFKMMDELLTHQRNELKAKKFTAALDTRRKSLEQLSNNARKEMGALPDSPPVSDEELNAFRRAQTKSK